MKISQLVFFHRPEWRVPNLAPGMPYTGLSSPVEWSDQRTCGMKSSNKNDGVVSGTGVVPGVVPGVLNWVASSIFGLAGTVLLVCWLLAYALEPDGWFARVGLMLALAAYGIDLAREKWGKREEVAPKGVGTGTRPATKAA